MGWIYLIFAGLCEVGFTTCLKFSNNFTNLIPSIGFFILTFASFGFLSHSLKWIPLGTAYAVWTGIGAFGTAALGIAYFGEPGDLWRVSFLVLLILSIIGLKVVS